MARLIDADRMKEELLWGNVFLPAIQTNTLVDLIDNQPTIDPESLRPRAHWVSDWMYVNGKQVCAKWCSSCGFQSWMKTDYCHHCGAKMEEMATEKEIGGAP